MNQKHSFPLLTQKMLDENQSSLNGLFMISENMRGNELLKNLVAQTFMTEKNDIVFLKNGLLHNEEGPALIHNNLQMVYYFTNGLIRHNPNEPSAINYSVKGKIKGDQFIPASHASNTFYSHYQSPIGFNHCVFGPSIQHSLDSEKASYYINNNKLTKEEWEKHPEVLEYFGRIQLKEKMHKNFGEGK